MDYSNTISIRNLYLGYRKARLGKRYKTVQQKYEFHLEINLANLHEKLKNPKNYKPKKYRKFTIYEPKMREVAAPSFEDQIVHQALFTTLEPPIRKKFIKHSYACIKNRGTHKAVRDIQKSLKNLKEYSFYLKTDIKSYFASINHAILKEILKKYIKDLQTLTLLNKIIDSFEESPQTGLPLGNVTSQLFANIYLNELDQFVTKKLMPQRDFSTYFRYMDDFVLLSESKKRLIKYRNEIEQFLINTLDLKLHPRKRLIQKISFGIDFCGYNIFANKILMRKETVRKFVRKWKKRNIQIERLKSTSKPSLFPNINKQQRNKIKSKNEKLRQSVTSHFGFIQHANFDLTKENFVYTNCIRLPYIPKSVNIR